MYDSIEEQRDISFKSALLVGVLAMSGIDDAPKLYQQFIDSIYTDKFVEKEETSKDFFKKVEEFFNIKLEDSK